MNTLEATLSLNSSTWHNAHDFFFLSSIFSAVSNKSHSHRSSQSSILWKILSKCIFSCHSLLSKMKMNYSCTKFFHRNQQTLQVSLKLCLKWKTNPKFHIAQSQGISAMARLGEWMGVHNKLVWPTFFKSTLELYIFYFFQRNADMLLIKKVDK